MLFLSNALRDLHIAVLVHPRACYSSSPGAAVDLQAWASAKNGAAMDGLTDALLEAALERGRVPAVAKLASGLGCLQDRI